MQAPTEFQRDVLEACADVTSGRWDCTVERVKYHTAWTNEWPVTVEKVAAALEVLRLLGMVNSENKPTMLGDEYLRDTEEEPEYD